MMSSLYSGGIAFAVCLILLPVFMKAARHFGLIDQPTARKNHHVPTPLVGGIAIFCAVAASVYWGPDGAFSVELLGWFCLVLLIGVFDDILDVSYRIRLLSHAVIVFGIFVTNGLFVREVGALFGEGAIRIGGNYAVFFTMIGVIGAVNAVNMSDGADGLLGGLTLISLATIFLIALPYSDGTHQITAPGIAMFLGAMLAFMLFNSRMLGLKRALVFMGDAGSTTIGFVLAYLLIDYSQGSNALLSPVVAGWIIGLPLLDASGVILYRVLTGHSPFHPDRAHLHHLLIDAGFSVNKTVATLAFAHISMIGIALAAYKLGGGLAEAVLFWGFIGLVIARAGIAKIYHPGAICNSDVPGEVETGHHKTASPLRKTQKGTDVSVMVGTTSSKEMMDNLPKADVG